MCGPPLPASAGAAPGAFDPGHPAAHAILALLATGTLVESAVHAGRVEGIEPFVARFERWAQWDRRAWTQVVAHYCRALITQGEEAERHYQAALAVEGLGELPLELARTELLYGEWLRRQRRKVDARVHLRAALAVFERLGASTWAERTRSELQASGHTVGYHLHKLYAKLGIASRAELRQLEQNDGHDGASRSARS